MSQAKQLNAWTKVHITFSVKIPWQHTEHLYCYVPVKRLLETWPCFSVAFLAWDNKHFDSKQAKHRNWFNNISIIIIIDCKRYNNNIIKVNCFMQWWIQTFENGRALCGTLAARNILCDSM